MCIHLKAIAGAERCFYPKLTAAMHRLRARVFHDRLGWDVTIINGQEIDEFDSMNPTYMLAIIDNQTVAGCVRLLPATGPTMLESTFPQLLRDGKLHAHPAMIETSRFCVDTALAVGRTSRQLHEVTLALLAATIDWSMRNGYTEIVTATDLRFERILRRAGWDMTRLGEPSPIGNTMAVAGTLPADMPSFMRLRQQGYRSDFRQHEERTELA